MIYYKYHLAFTIIFILSNVYAVGYHTGNAIKILLTRAENDIDNVAIDTDAAKDATTDPDTNLNIAVPAAILTAESIQFIQQASESHTELEVSLSTQSETSSYDATSLQMNILSGSLQDVGIDLGALGDVGGLGLQQDIVQ